MQIDLVEKKAKNWHDEGSVPSEPFFVARPGATQEDDGTSLPYGLCFSMCHIINGDYININQIMYNFNKRRI